MSFPCRNPFFPALMAAIVIGAYSCANSPKAGDSSGNPDAAPDSGTSQSNADQVGSVPEDMLADEKSVEGAAADATQPDPFGDLAEKGDVDRWKDLHDLNREALKSGNQLRKGMKLRYEAPLEAFEPDQAAHTYEIKKGDTLARIADEVYGRQAKYKKLQGFNKHLIKNPNRIFAGFTIFYDITEKEIAEAEARRAQRQAGATPKETVKEAAAPAAADAPAELPSAIKPPSEAAPAEKKVASTPSATDNSAEPGPQSAGPPAPSAQ